MSAHNIAAENLRMIINAKTVILSLIVISIVGYFALQMIRQFALSIALENHQANEAMDSKEEAERKKKIALADIRASDAFKKVEPLIKKGSRPSTPVRVREEDIEKEEASTKTDDTAALV